MGVVTDGVQRDAARPHLLVLGDWRLAPRDPLPDAGGCHQRAVAIIAVRRSDIDAAFQRPGKQQESGHNGNLKIILTRTILYEIIRSRSIRTRAN
jgi:hypothetical protein